MKLKKIILVYKTHFDIGFTDLSEKVIAQYAGDMLRDVVNTCKGTQNLGKLKYVWTMPAWPLWHMVNHCSPDLKKDLDELIENGQVVWHALPFTSHTDFCSQMEYIEGLRYAKKLSDIYQKPYPISAKMTDVPGHSIMLPDILDQAGVRFLHLGCNEFASPPKVPDLFFWEAPGGRRVLTMYSKGGYGTGLVPPTDWEFPVWMALMHTHDNSGPQSAEMIRNLKRHLQEMYPGVEVVSGTMDDFYHELEQYGLGNVPVVKEDLADTWIHGINSYPGEIAVVRENRRKMEKLQTVYTEKLLEGWTGTDDAEKILDTYYEEICLFEEHTWGADVKTWLGPDRVYGKDEFLQKKETEAYQFMEKSWAEQRERAYRADVCRAKLEQLFGAEGLKTDTAGNTQNTAGNLKGTRKKHFRINGIGDDVRIENNRYELLFSKVTGQILELNDKILRKTVMKARGKEGIFSYRYDKYGYDDINEYLRHYGYHFTTWGIQDYGREGYPCCEHETFFPAFEKYEIDEDRVIFFYTASDSADKYGDAFRIALEIIFPGEESRLYVNLSLFQKQESPYVEAGSFIMPFAEEGIQFYVQKGGTLLDPAKDLAEGANHSLYCMENGMIAVGEKAGVCIRSLDTPLAAIGTPGVYRYSPKYTEHIHPGIYVNLFNNMWGTNFPQWIGGNLEFRFEITFFDRKDTDGAKAWMEMLETSENCGKTEGNVGNNENIRFPEGMKLIGARKAGKGSCLYFSDVWGKNGRRFFSAKGYRICRQDLMGRPGSFYKDEITFDAASYGVECFYLEKREDEV